MNILIRPARAEDVPFIASSWLETYRRSPVGEQLHVSGKNHAVARYTRILDPGKKPSLYYPLQRALIESLLPRCVVKVACDPGAEDVVYGWIAYEPPTLLHYVAVKVQMHGHGVGRALMVDAGLGRGGLRFTHWTDEFEGRMRKKNPEWEYKNELVIPEQAA